MQSNNSQDQVQSDAFEQAPLLEIVEQAVQRIPVVQLCPHPLNRPATGVKREQIDTLKLLISQNGYDGNKPLTVRPKGEKYEIIEGHHRWLAATELGFTELPCSVKDLDDIDANILMLTSNQQEGNDPLDIGLNALDTTTKGKHKSDLSLSAFAKRIGKTGAYLTQVTQGAGIYRKLLSQLNNFEADYRQACADKLMSPTHLNEMDAPDSVLPMLYGLIKQQKWNVKETRAASDRIRSVADITPDWLLDVSSVYPKVAMEPGYAKSTAAAIKTAVDCYNRLPETATLYRSVKTDEVKTIGDRDYCKWVSEPYEINPRELFVMQMLKTTIPASQDSEKAYRNILSDIQGKSSSAETWLPIRNEYEEREYQEHLAEIERITLRQEFTPKIYHADALEKLRELSSSSFDLICIDPPYNMDKADWDSYGSGKEFAEWARPWLKECKRVLNDSGSLYIFGINRMLSHIQHVLDDLGMNYRNWIIWDTIQGAGGGLWVNRHEAILYYSKTSDSYENTDAVKLERHEENIREYKGKEYAFKNPSNVWRFPCVDDKHPERTDHPTQKPVELIERIVLANSPIHGRVLDCFMGSGTTGVACMKHRRYCVGIEKDANYIDIANSRFAETGVGE